MSNSGNNGCVSILGILATLSTVVVPLFIGYKTWVWLSPDSFGEFIIFVLAWGLIGGIVTPIVYGIIGLIISAFVD